MKTIAALASRVIAKAGIGFGLAGTVAVLVTIVIRGVVPDASAAGGKIPIVAAENFYGDIARQIGGDSVTVTSILSNPDQDPHLFETTPSVARELAAAQIVIFNGADYDPWIETLLKSSPRPGRTEISAAQLLQTPAGANPHLWYATATMPAVAKTLAAALTAADPEHGMAYAERLKTFITSLNPVNRKIAEIGAKFSGAPVTATEPVFGYMASALHLTMRNKHFQLSIMNDTEPSASDVAAFEQDLRTHKVRVMFYNKQASDKAVQNLVDIARASKIPVVGVTETAPAGASYQQWMLDQLNATEKALTESKS